MVKDIFEIVAEDNYQPSADLIAERIKNREYSTLSGMLDISMKDLISPKSITKVLNAALENQKYKKEIYDNPGEKVDEKGVISYIENNLNKILNTKSQKYQNWNKVLETYR